MGNEVSHCNGEKNEFLSRVLALEYYFILNAILTEAFFCPSTLPLVSQSIWLTKSTDMLFVMQIIHIQDLLCSLFSEQLDNGLLISVQMISFAAYAAVTTCHVFFFSGNLILALLVLVLVTLEIINSNRTFTISVN